jgi:hypothetical protein
MSIQLKMLEADRREILAHIAVFPDDRYGRTALAKIEEDILRATPPMTADQRKSTLRGVRATQFIVDDPHAEVNKAPWNKGFVVPAPDDIQEVVARNREKYNGEGDGATRYTFGADYEMDQRWLAAERDKETRPLSNALARATSPAELDRMMFPTVAFNLTSMYNLNYGTSRY